MGYPASTRVRRALTAAVICCAFAGLSLSAAEAAPTAQESIVGGEAGSIVDLPSLAFIEAADPRGSTFDCTGTVIAPRLILTAAHCAENLEAGGFTPASDYLVATGADDLRQVDRRDALRVESTHVYPEFDPGNLHGDAAILVLASPTSATPIPLATSADIGLYAGGATVRLAGWGLTDGESNSAPKRLQTTTTVVQDPASCKRRTRRFNPTYSPAFQLCTQNPPELKTGGCFGDSGGPVIAQRSDGSPVEIGVVSTGAPRCSTKLPNIFTRVDKVSTWAAEWVAAIETGAPPPTLKPQLPTLSGESAEGFVGTVLRTELGNLFIRSSGLQGRCNRLGRPRVRCELAWLHGSKIYFANVTVFYVLQNGAVGWDNSFIFERVSRRCFESDHRQSCTFQTKRG